MIDAYIDESGIHDEARICVLAGYFGGIGQFKKLDKAWRKTLNDFGFPLEEFHTKELIKQQKHYPMLMALAEVIAKQPKIAPIVWAIVVEDFNSLSMPQRRFLTGAYLNSTTGQLVGNGCPRKPYFVPFQNVIKSVCDYAPVGGKAHFAFGVDRPAAQYASSFFDELHNRTQEHPQEWQTWKSRNRLGTPFFPEAKKTPQLQAADLLAYSSYARFPGYEGRYTERLKKIHSLCLVNSRSKGDRQYQNLESLQRVLAKARNHVHNAEI